MFIRLFFHLLYHQLAWTYDLVAWLVSFGHWKAWGRAAIPRLRGQRVLELAHGPGHLMAAMRQVGLSPVGLDLSPQMGQLARGRLRRSGVPLPPLVRARAQALPFRAGSFDSVVSTFPTEFIVDPATLREIARVILATAPPGADADVGPGGRAVIVPGVVFNAGWPARLLKWLYTITGQQEPAPPGLADRLAEVGLTVEQEREQMGMVEVIVAVANR